jgi:uncharacterized membrane protein YfcA
MSGLSLLLLFLAAAGGGAINSVAGGGSFVSFPALLFAGVDPKLANATNTVVLWPAGLASVTAYRSEARIEWERDPTAVVALTVASLLGGIAGGLLLLYTKTSTFVMLIPWLMLLASLLFTFGGRFARSFTGSSGSRMTLMGICCTRLFTATYGGYFGGGLGILMLAELSVLGMTNIHAMNALKTYYGVIINGAAVVLFLWAGMVDARLGLVMVGGSIFGGYAGAALARRISPQKVRSLVLIVAWSMTAYFFLKQLR